MNVVSLCDGMSCARICLEQAGIKVDKYYASEIKDIGIKVSKENYPDIIQIGDVNNVSYSDGVLHTEVGDFEDNIDLVVFGSPCQSLSVAMKTDKRVGLQDKAKSGLFFECYRILKEINPKYFLMENVASMRNSDRDIITEYMGVEPIKIDARLLSPSIRKRYYWTNIPVDLDKLEKKDISFQSVLNAGFVERERARCLCVTECRPLKTPIKMFYRDYSTGFWNLIFKSKEHYEKCIETYLKISGGKRRLKTSRELDKYIGTDIAKVFEGVRYMDSVEMERCMGIPEGYTKCLSRNDAANVIGDGFSIPVVSFIFSFIQ